MSALEHSSGKVAKANSATAGRSRKAAGANASAIATHEEAARTAAAARDKRGVSIADAHTYELLRAYHSRAAAALAHNDTAEYKQLQADIKRFEGELSGKPAKATKAPSAKTSAPKTAKTAKTAKAPKATKTAQKVESEDHLTRGATNRPRIHAEAGGPIKISMKQMDKINAKIERDEEREARRLRAAQAKQDREEIAQGRRMQQAAEDRAKRANAQAGIANLMNALGNHAARTELEAALQAYTTHGDHARFAAEAKAVLDRYFPSGKIPVTSAGQRRAARAAGIGVTKEPSAPAKSAAPKSTGKPAATAKATAQAKPATSKASTRLSVHTKAMQAYRNEYDRLAKQFVTDIHGQNRRDVYAAAVDLRRRVNDLNREAQQRLSAAWDKLEQATTPAAHRAAQRAVDQATKDRAEADQFAWGPVWDLSAAARNSPETTDRWLQTHAREYPQPKRK